MFNNNFDYKIRCVKGDDNGNLLVLNMDIGDNNITLVNLYGPNTDLPSFYEDISNILGDFDATHVIICGDWNLILDVSKDCVNYSKVNNPLSRQRVLQLCGDWDLVDVWRAHNPDLQRFTWRQHDTLKQSRRTSF